MFDSGHYAAPAIMILTIGISLLGMYQLPDIINRFLFRPYFFLRERQYATMIMSGFIHADMTHLMFNMITFYFFALPLERFLGTSRFVVLYFVGLVVSHTCSWFKERRNPQYASLGASGAISAVLFAFIVYFPSTMLLVFFIPMPALLRWLTSCSDSSRPTYARPPYSVLLSTNPNRLSISFSGTLP